MIIKEVRALKGVAWYVQIIVIASIFIYYFLENFVMSADWEILSLRSIDDFAMHDSVRRMQEAILSGEFKKVLTFFDYGYGNVFWLANAVVFLPFYFFDSVQTQIVAGRQLSLLFIFGSMLLIGKIGQKLRPDAPLLRVSVMLIIATSPMLAIIGTKFHVNAQCIFFGILAYYTLIRDDVLGHKAASKAALWAGVAVGLKLTALFIMPIIYATLWLRITQAGTLDVRKGLLEFSVRFGLVSAACTVPAILLFPFFTRDLAATYATFQMYKNMGADFSEKIDLLTSITETLSYSIHPAAFGIIALLFFNLARTDARKGNFIATILGLGVLCAYALVLLTVQKPPLYQATYVLSASYFVPLGLLGVSDLRLPSAWRGGVALCIVLIGTGLSRDFRERALPLHRFFEIARSSHVTNQLQALEGMRAAIGQLRTPVRIYQDYTTVFPATRFSKGVEVVYCYGTLRDYTPESLGRFDYVALNSEHYIFKMPPSSAQYKNATDSERRKADQEEAARKRMRETGILGGVKYKLIYEGHNALLYKRVDQ
ncbi:MAG: hypothetical protein KGL90_11055 [Burkholderiales bacterium]|nr:hypothetical protein [Burkholderiales bacterium]